MPKPKPLRTLPTKPKPRSRRLKVYHCRACAFTTGGPKGLTYHWRAHPGHRKRHQNSPPGASSGFCGHCGSPRLDPSHTFCTRCGKAHSPRG